MENGSRKHMTDRGRRSKHCCVTISGRGKVVCADALDFLGTVRKQTADIIFLDPPFNLGKDYGDGDGTSDQLEEYRYEAYMKAVISRSAELLKEGGALYLYHIPRWAIRFARVLEQRLDFRHWIAVSMKNGFPYPNGLYPAHYALLYFTKGKPRSFSRPKVPPQLCRHCNGLVKDYGGYLRFVENGVNLSDVWDDISPVRHSKHKHRPCNELSLVVLDRVVQISGSKGGLLVDPFVGSGTSAVAAVRHGMKFSVCDNNVKYCRMTVTRVKEVLSELRGSREKSVDGRREECHSRTSE